MIDTLKLESPPLTLEAYEYIHDRLAGHRHVDHETGETKSSVWKDIVGPNGVLIRVTLLNSPHSGVCLEPSTTSRPNRIVARSPACSPYLVIEGSVHKLLLGHNIDGGPMAIQPSCRWFVHLVGELLQVHLDPADKWRVTRADWAEVYTLQRDLIPNLMNGLLHAHYPRRKRVAYGSDSIAFPGQSTTLNLYHKGPEIRSNDRDRLSVCRQPAEIDSLLNLAKDTLRVEVQVKAPQLKHNFGHKPQVSEINEDYLASVFDDTLDRLNFDPGGQALTLRDAIEVEASLTSTYTARKAHTLLGAWHRLVVTGEDNLRKQVPRATLYRWKMGLREAGCSWLATDRDTIPSSLPPGFCLTRDSPYRRRTVDDKVRIQLLRFLVPDFLHPIQNMTGYNEEFLSVFLARFPIPSTYQPIRQ